MNSFNKVSINRNPFIQFTIIFWPPISIFLLHVFLVRVTNIYILYPWLDIPTHYLGGLSIAYSFSFALTFLQGHQMVNQLDKSIEFILIFTLVSTVAVFWEFAEFLLDQLLGTNLQISLPDTMKDFLLGMLGAVSLIGFKILTSLEREYKSSKS